MNKLLLVLFFAALIAGVEAKNYTIATTANTYNVYSQGQGKWVAETWYNDGTVAAMNRCSSANFLNSICAAGEGNIQNATVSDVLTADAAFIEGSRLKNGNTTLTFTINSTGVYRIFGWYQHTTTTAHNYNFSILDTKNPIFTASGSDNTNTTYDTGNVSFTAGDNVTFSVAAMVLGQDPYVKFTATIQAVNNPFYDSLWSLGLIAVDEVTGLQKQFNLTVSNSTNTTNYGNATTFNLSNFLSPVGTITLSFKNNTCLTGNIITRSITLDTSTLSLGNSSNLALLCDGSIAILQAFRIVDASNAAVPGVTISIYSNALNLIASGTSDAAGLFSAYLITSNNYVLSANKTGYTSYSGTFQATGNLISIPLPLITNYTTYPGRFASSRWDIVPDFLGYPLFTINASVNATNLISYGLNLTFANTTQLYYVSLSNATGSQNFTTPWINRTGWNGTLFVTLFTQASDFGNWSYTAAYSLGAYNDTNSSVTAIIRNLANANVPPSMGMVIAIFASLIFASAGGLAFSGAGAGLAFLASFGFFSLGLGFVDTNLFIFISILTLAAYAFTRGF